MQLDNLPQSWDKISIGQYIELRPYIEMKADTPLKIIEKTIGQLMVLTGKAKEEIEQIRATDVKAIQEELAWMYELPPMEIPERFTIEGRHYAPTLYKEDMTAGQFMSVTELLKDSRENSDLAWQQLHVILLNVCIEVDANGQKVEIENEAKWIKQTSEEFFNHFPFSIAYPIAVFFCELSKILPAVIQDCSIAIAKAKVQEVEALVKGGDGL